MATKQEMNNKFFTEKGLSALTARVGSLIKLYNQGHLKAYILGFGPFVAESKEELLYRIKETAELIGYHWELKKEIEKSRDGKETIKDVII